jgi:hypothetical protein
LISWPTFVDSDRIYSDLATLVPFVEPGSAVMALNLGPNPPHRLWSPVVAMGHVVAVRGGRAMFDYSQSPVSPVAQRPEKQWAEPVDRLEGHPYDMRPAWDFTRFRYVLMATPKPTLAAAAEMAITDEARLVASKGDWYLFESRLPLVPIDADDAPLPTPRPATLRKKLRDVARDLEQQIEREGEHPSE